MSKIESGTILNGGNLILLMLLLSACRTLVAQQGPNEVFKTVHIVYDTVTHEERFAISLVDDYVLCISNYRDSIFLIPYKIASKESNNYYCFDFPRGNPKWDYKNMLLRKKQILNLESIKKQKKLLEYARLNNEAFVESLEKTNDSLNKKLFELGLSLKEGIKKVEFIGEKRVAFFAVK